MGIPSARSLAQQRFMAWIAMLAILMAALAPSISQAVAAWRSNAAPWDEICSVSAYVPADAQAGYGKSRPADGTEHLTHCPYCVTHAGATGMPPAEPAIALPASGTEIRPVLYYRSPRPLFSWAPAQSRAPPAIS